MKNNGCGCLAILLVLMLFAPQLFFVAVLLLIIMALLKYLAN